MVQRLGGFLIVGQRDKRTGYTGRICYAGKERQRFVILGKRLGGLNIVAGGLGIL